MSPHDLRRTAHQALALSSTPWLRYQKTGRHQVREGVAFTRQDFSGPGFNFAAVLGPSPPLAEIEELAREFFAEAEGGWGVLVEGDAGHPVEAELRARCWPVAEDEPALVLPAIANIPEPPPGLEIRAAADEEEARDFGRVVAAAFEVADPGQGDNPPTAAGLRDPEMALLIGRLEGRPVCAAMLACVARTAVIAGVATVPDARGRGFGTSITWAAAVEGARRGCRAAALRSGPMSLNLYQRMGFVPVCAHRTYAHAESGWKADG